jgi:prolycopene isomerase
MERNYISKKINLNSFKEDEYDVIIVGAGVGGLTCGCFLARAGKKVIIIEKNNKVGGYCSSFKQDEFTFDLGPRSVSHCEEGSYIREVLRDLNLNLKLIKVGVSDCIVTPNYKIRFYSDVGRTIEQLQYFFPKEAKKIKPLFDLINNINQNSILAPFYQQFKNKTFRDVLDEYFKNEMLKSILKIPLGNLASPSFRASAISSVMLYHGHLFKGGYYLKGGMQALSDSLVATFEKYGGKILLSNKVSKIEFKQNSIKKVILENKEFFLAKDVVCNCDPTYVLSNFIERKFLNKKFVAKFKELIPSTSAFIVCLGLKDTIKRNIDDCCGLWYSSNYDTDKFYFNISMKKANRNANHILFAFPSFHDCDFAPQNCETVVLIMWVPYKNENFWNKNNAYFKEMIITRAKTLIHNLSSLIRVEKTVSPIILQRYTFNRDGSVRGWEVLPSQLRIFQLLKKVVQKRIFFVGHWASYYAP